MDKTETTEGPAGWHADRFEAAPKPRDLRPRVEVGEALVRWGAMALERARNEPDWIEVRDAGWLLGGLSRSVVAAVLMQFQQRAPASLDRGIQRLGELCGALFLEHLCATRTLMIPLSARLQGTRRAIAVGRRLSRAPFAERLHDLFALTPGEATKLFLGFISATEGQPSERLRRSIYGQFDGV